MSHLRNTAIVSGLGAVLLVTACGPTDPTNTNWNGNNNGNHQIWYDAGTQGDAGTPDNCAEHARFVYVIDSDDTLYRFNPQINNVSAFTEVGPVSCGATLNPNSMSVSRDGFAYALFGSYDDLFGLWSCSGVYRVDMQTGACLGQTSFSCGDAGFSQFGMGFSTTTVGGSVDELFLANSDTASLGKLDVATGAVQSMGTLPNQGGEFTGNSNAELWGFFPYEDPPAIIWVDKANGAALDRFDLPQLPSLSGAMVSAAWAFAFWGGDFYVFYQVDPPDTSTNVWKLDRETGLQLYIPNTGMRIVGAGVSTCAPVVVR